MPKEKEPEKTEIEPNLETPPKIDEIEKKVEKKVEAAKTKIEKKTGERENLIGELADPKIDDSFNYGDWAKKFDEKLDRILASHEPKETPPPESVPETNRKIPWYERELI